MPHNNHKQRLHPTRIDLTGETRSQVVAILDKRLWFLEAHLQASEATATVTATAPAKIGAK